MIYISTSQTQFRAKGWKAGKLWGRHHRTPILEVLFGILFGGHYTSWPKGPQKKKIWGEADSLTDRNRSADSDFDESLCGFEQGGYPYILAGNHHVKPMQHCHKLGINNPSFTHTLVYHWDWYPTRIPVAKQVQRCMKKFGSLGYSCPNWSLISMFHPFGWFIGRSPPKKIIPPTATVGSS